MTPRSWIAAAGLALLLSPTAQARDFADLPRGGTPFRSFYVTWGGTTNAVFGKFLKEVRPEIVQCGFYGPMFHGYADDPKSTGYPMQLPVAGQREALAVQRAVNRTIHGLGLKAVGHFQMVNVIADPAKTNGFLAFYDHGWPTNDLGPRPHPDVRELLMRDGTGNVLSNVHYVTYVGLCWNSPYATDMLKRMLKLAVVEGGLDGVVVNYNYRWACACPYCQAGFRNWLGDHYSSDQLRALFGITNLAAHVFPAIAGSIPGYAESNAPPLEREAQFWAAAAYKKAFDGIFIDYGRSLKKDLIVATWNHLGDISVSEERAYLPLGQWGKGENYFWYSGGYGPTKMADRKLGDGWMDCLYLRELGRGKPFMLGKYEPVRMRNSVAEGLAMGGSGMGLYMDIADPDGYTALAQYLAFSRRFPFLFDNLESAAEVAFLWPRADVQAGNKAAAAAFRDAGRLLSERQVVMDALADGFADSNRLARYKAVLVPGPAVLPDGVQEELNAYARRGGAVLRMDTNAAAEVAGSLKTLSGCAVEAPWTVKAMLWKGKGRRVLHLVNYDRDEDKAKTRPNKPQAECPVPASNIVCRLALPAGATVTDVRLYRPESEKPEPLEFTLQENGSVGFVVSQFAVYGVVDVRGRNL
jgi:hypothetical protein